MPPLTRDDPVGRVGGRYELLRRLGSGGMGVVYLAVSPQGRLVAIKMIRPEKLTDDFRRRFRREIAATRSMRAWTATIVDVGLDDEPPWFASEYLPVPDLKRMVDSLGPLSRDVLIALAGGLAEALSAAHRAELVHRDLKPANILVGADGPRLIDFGIVRSLDPEEHSSITPTGAIVGTPGYIPPERYRGMPAGPAGDVFALGAVLVYAATGHPAFPGDGEQIARRVLGGHPDLDGVPPFLLPHVRRCLVTDPRDRPGPTELMRSIGWLPSAGQSGMRTEDIARTRLYRKDPFVGHPDRAPDPPPRPRPRREASPPKSPPPGVARRRPSPGWERSGREKAARRRGGAQARRTVPSPTRWPPAAMAAALPGAGTFTLLVAVTALPWSASLAIAAVGFVISLLAVVAGQATGDQEGDGVGSAVSGCLAVPCGLLAVVLLLIESPLPWWGSVLAGLGGGLVLVIATLAMPFLLREALGRSVGPAGAASAIGFAFGVLNCCLLGWGSELTFWVAVPIGILAWVVTAAAIAWLGAPRRFVSAASTGA